MKSGLMYGMNFQKATSPSSWSTVIFHDENLIMITCIAALMAGMITSLWTKKFSSSDFVESEMLEVGWTVIPIMMLITLGIPSLELLYFLDNPSTLLPNVTLKVVGRQWYWSYEINSLSYDSYMDSSSEGFRLLEVDNPAFLPRAQYVRLLVTSGDVIHSFCVPSLGMKMDAVPGRLNQISVFPLKLGSFYGQCSEICGANHSFMPINLEMLPTSVFTELAG